MATAQTDLGDVVAAIATVDVGLGRDPSKFRQREAVHGSLSGAPSVCNPNLGSVLVERMRYLTRRPSVRAYSFRDASQPYTSRPSM